MEVSILGVKWKNVFDLKAAAGRSSSTVFSVFILAAGDWSGCCLSWINNAKQSLRKNKCLLLAWNSTNHQSDELKTQHLLRDLNRNIAELPQHAAYSTAAGAHFTCWLTSVSLVGFVQIAIRLQPSNKLQQVSCGWKIPLPPPPRLRSAQAKPMGQ